MRTLLFRVFFLIVCLATPGSAYATPDNDDRAEPMFYGKTSAKTVKGRAAASYAYAAPTSSVLVNTARRYIGTNPTRRTSLWCGAFMSLALQEAGFRPGGNLASSYASYGPHISGPQVGALAVMSRGKRGGHVGVVSGITPEGNVVIVSGNHNNTVAEAVYPRNRIYAYVLPR